MPRVTYKQRLAFFLCAGALLVLSFHLTMFAILVIDYGLWRVITEPIYPVATKPTTVLSNGVVWSEAKSLVAFLITCILWFILFRITKPQMHKWIGTPPDYFDRK
jgi:hypothetical protein